MATKENEEKILSMSKKELFEAIAKMPLYQQPKWLKTGGKKELAEFLIKASEVGFYTPQNKVCSELGIKEMI